MKVAILSSKNNNYYYNILEKKFDELIEASQCFLFYILCGYVKGGQYSISLGETWAKAHGAPILYISGSTVEELLNKLFKEADYIIFLNDESKIIKSALMKYKMLGKHGTVINIPRE